jgi:hypothetical protein
MLNKYEINMKKIKIMSQDGNVSSEFTPAELCQEILDKIDVVNKTILTFNIEFVLTLIYKYNVDRSNITICTDDDIIRGICERCGVKCIDTMEPNMKFDVVIGNPPYQAPKKNDKRGTGGNNSLYIKFIDKAVDTVKAGGVISLITPPAAIVKTTILHKPTPTLAYLMKNGSIESIDFTAKKHFPSVGSAICKWSFVKDKRQGPVDVKFNEFEGLYPVEDIFYLPPDSLNSSVNLTEVELNLFNKVISNKKGQRIQVVRGKNKRECTMARFGYPKVRVGGGQELSFDKKFYEFFSSKTGLWLLDYIRRHDQIIYHNILSGMIIPKDGFELTKDESVMINKGNWVNNDKRERRENIQ